MGIKSPNIIQIEFFSLIGSSLEEVVNSASDRALEGGRVKMVVRLFEGSFAFTTRLQEITRLDNSYIDLVSALQDAKGLRRGLLIWKVSQNRNKRQHLARPLLPMAVDCLERALNNADKVCFEPSSINSFRPLMRSEEHEAIERAKQSNHVWIFIFPPGPLLSESPGKVLTSYI